MKCESCIHYVESKTGNAGRCLVFSMDLPWGAEHKNCRFGRRVPAPQPEPQPTFTACVDCESAARRKITDLEEKVRYLDAENDRLREMVRKVEDVG